MDVTFYENQSFYPKTYIQGENIMQEFQFWDEPQPNVKKVIFDLSPFSTFTPIPPNSDLVMPLETKLNETHSPILNSNVKEICVYQRRQ